MLNNKVVVITGGAGLIGQEFVKVIAQNNGIAVIADINQKQAELTKKKLCDTFHFDSIDAIKLNITSKDSISKAISYLDNKYGNIDALINSAYPKSKNYGKHFFDVEYDDFCDNVSQHLGGYFLTSQQFIQYFIKQGYGNIVNMASIYGVIAPKFDIYDDTQMTTPVEYSVIKSALLNLTKYMAKYCKGNNIKINAISPGGILDGQPQKFLDKYNAQCLSKGMLDSLDINGTLLYLLSDLSTYINGQNIIVDDGFCL